MRMMFACSGNSKALISQGFFFCSCLEDIYLLKASSLLVVNQCNGHVRLLQPGLLIHPRLDGDG